MGRARRVSARRRYPNQPADQDQEAMPARMKAQNMGPMTRRPRRADLDSSVGRERGMASPPRWGMKEKTGMAMKPGRRRRSWAGSRWMSRIMMMERIIMGRVRKRRTAQRAP